MKQNILTAVITVIVGVIVAYFTYVLNKEVFDVRYTLSEKIPTKIIDAQAVENVQQLVVKNNGNNSVSKIQIKIKRNIEKTNILKHSLSDIVTERMSNGYFEATYPELPPGGFFTYSFKTLAEGISKTDMEIRHSKGEVKDALSSGSKTIASMITDAIFILVIIFYASMGTITLLVSLMESKVRYESYDAFLKRKKPFYISHNKWNKLRKEAIENFSTSGYANPRDIENTLSYKALNREKPDYLNEEEWQLLLAKAIKQFEKDYAEAISSRSSDKLKTYFAVQKPIFFPAGKWSSFLNDLSDEYVARKKYDLARYPGTFKSPDIEKEINSEMPRGMDLGCWDEYIAYLKRQYYGIISEELYSNFTKSSMELIKQFNLDFFDKNKREAIAGIAYKIEAKNILNSISESNAEEFIMSDKPAWLDDNDWRKLLNQAQKLIEADKLKNKYEQLLAEVNKKSHELQQEKVTVSELKQKIEKQLRIVHEFIADPTVVDRIEEYDDIFSPGNFENLKRLSQSLKEHQAL